MLPGETLSGVAKRYHVSPAAIRRANRLEGDSLRAGQRLKVATAVPSASRLKGKYRVKKGDTLASVAKKHKMSVALMRRLNPGADGTLRLGQGLWVVTETPVPRDRRKGLYCLESGPGFSVIDPRHAWGTMLTVSRVAEVLSEYSIRHPDAPSVLIGDLSKEGGGFLAPHLSHRRGRDVDIRYPLKVPTTQYVPATASTLEVKGAWTLIRAFIKTGDVEYVFVSYRLQKLLYEYAQSKGVSQERLAELFQYPRGKRSMVGIIRHEPGHRTHFHVRFKPEATDQTPTS